MNSIERVVKFGYTLIWIQVFVITCHVQRVILRNFLNHCFFQWYCISKRFFKVLENATIITVLGRVKHRLPLHHVLWLAKAVTMSSNFIRYENIIHVAMNVNFAWVSI